MSLGATKNCWPKASNFPSDMKGILFLRKDGLGELEGFDSGECNLVAGKGGGNGKWSGDAEVRLDFLNGKFKFFVFRIKGERAAQTAVVHGIIHALRGGRFGIGLPCFACLEIDFDIEGGIGNFLRQAGLGVGLGGGQGSAAVPDGADEIVFALGIEGLGVVFLAAGESKGEGECREGEEFEMFHK